MSTALTTPSEKARAKADAREFVESMQRIAAERAEENAVRREKDRARRARKAGATP